MFGEIAPGYDRANHVLSLNVDRYWRRVTVKSVWPDREGPLLDVCTGTGDLALAYYRATSGKYPIVGADFCPQMLLIAREKARRLGAEPTIGFVEADAQALPFAGGTFQIVTVAFGLRNVADTDRGLSEMMRVLKPGGRLAVLEFSSPTRQPMRAAYAIYLRHVLPRVGQFLVRNRAGAYNYLTDSVGEFSAGPSVAARMLAAGFSTVDVRPLTFGIATLYVGRK
jgi:demethylmenaquinone methyltransferase/2-methoxy-6-polyprenyl-1,4-benzoquinol methylase